MNFQHAIFPALVIACTSALHASTEDFRLAWSDEFEGPALDTNRWQRCPAWPIAADWDRPMSTSDELLDFTEGAIRLWGKRNEGIENDSREYLVAGITSRHRNGLMSPLGKVEIRAKFQDQQGAWPALWTMGEPYDRLGRSWPYNGEIDISERLNSDSYTHHTVHTGYTYYQNGAKNPAQGATAAITNGDWNVYGLEITTNALVFTINGTESFRYARNDATADQWPFSLPQFFILSMQLGGSWVGNPNLSTLPACMSVDYIRSYDRMLNRGSVINDGKANRAPKIAALADKLVCLYAKEGDLRARTSSDGARTWTEEMAVAAKVTPGGVGTNAAGRVLCWTRDAKGAYELYGTSDGQTFARVASPVFAVAPEHVSDLVVCGSSRLVSLWTADGSWGTLVSTDGGTSWVQTTIESGLVSAAAPAAVALTGCGESKLLALATSRDGTSVLEMVSGDGGVTWNRAAANLGDFAGKGISLVYNPASTGLLAFAYDAAAALLRYRHVDLENVFGNPQGWSASISLARGTVVADEALSATSVVLLDSKLYPVYCSPEEKGSAIAVCELGDTWGAGLSYAAAPVEVVESTGSDTVRYVATTGSDENDGRSLASAMATVKGAVRSIEANAVETDCTVYVAPGTYELAADSVRDWGVYLTNRISVVGISSNAADVVLVKASGEKSHPLFYLDNAAASLRYLTLREGKTANRWTENGGYGGGAYVLHGKVEDCVFDGCANGAYGGDGGGICLKNDARAARCVIRNGVNYYEGCRGAAVYASDDAVLEDSLICSTACHGDEGSVYLSGNAVAVNCTIVDNSAKDISGIRFQGENARAVNTIIYGNTASRNTWGGIGSAGCEAYLINCLFDTDPVFRDYAGGDYRPVAGSPAIDAGTARATYGGVSLLDLKGSPRAIGNVDLGCYENSKEGPECGFAWYASETEDPLTVVLVAEAYGVPSETFTWCLRNETTGEELAAVGQIYNWTPGAGVWTMTVSCGELAYTSPEKLTVSSKEIFVKSGNTTAAFPYATEQTAAADIPTALAAASDGVTVKILPGVYPIEEQLVIDRAVRIVGTAGDRYSTVITNVVTAGSRNSGAFRVFSLNHADAFVANLTLAGGRVHQDDASGGCLYISSLGGTVSNCFLTGGITYTEYSQEGAGAAALEGGLLTHCEIANCNTVKGGGYVSKDRVIRMGGGRISNCLIHDCTPTSLDVAAQEGRIMRVAAGARLDNCTLIDCSVVAGWPAVYAETAREGYEASAQIVNTAIFVTDESGAPVGCDGASTGDVLWTGCFRNCAAAIAIGDGENVAEDCVVASQNLCYARSRRTIYTPIAVGPLVNAGSADVVGMPAVDFNGKPRCNKMVDIGAYEFTSAGLVIRFK